MSTSQQARSSTSVPRFVRWRESLIDAARERKDEFFMGIPDAWYEPVTYGCTNGHVSTSVLRRDSGTLVCLACYRPVYIIPKITEEELGEILSANTEGLASPADNATPKP